MTVSLVTGGAGYIGSHIVELLIKNNSKVFIFDNLVTGYKKLINKTEVVYPSIHREKKIFPKEKKITFVGKLNESKGYDLYCKSLFKVLNENKIWNAVSIGEEKRFQDYPIHKRHKNLGQISHKKVLKHLSESLYIVFLIILIHFQNE